MLDFIRQWIINIVTLVLFIVMIEMLLPKGKMRKYAGLVTGTILIIAIINPLIGLFGSKFDFSQAQTANSIAINKIQIEKDSRVLEEEQLQQIVEVYRRNIIEQIENNAQEVEGVKDASADVIINEDHKSPSFGEIKRAYLKITTDGDGSSGGGDGSPKNVEVGADGVSLETAKAGGGSSGGGDSSSGRDSSVAVRKVESVRIGKAPGGQAADESCDPRLKKKLEDRIGQIFGVDRENIVITQMQE